MKPLGGLYSYDPKTQELKTLINGTYFGNGVVASKDQNYLLMVETIKYRIIKYWLSGIKKGETEIFMDNLSVSLTESLLEMMVIIGSVSLQKKSIFR